jgi:hypothetical protein
LWPPASRVMFPLVAIGWASVIVQSDAKVIVPPPASALRKPVSLQSLSVPARARLADNKRSNSGARAVPGRSKARLFGAPPKFRKRSPLRTALRPGTARAPVVVQLPCGRRIIRNKKGMG